MAVDIEPTAVRRNVPVTFADYRSDIKSSLWFGVGAVLDAAIMPNGDTDLRRGILTAVYNYDTESFEIRWDLAK